MGLLGGVSGAMPCALLPVYHSLASLVFPLSYLLGLVHLREVPGAGLWRGCYGDLAAEETAALLLFYPPIISVDSISTNLLHHCFSCHVSKQWQSDVKASYFLSCFGCLDVCFHRVSLVSQ